MLNRPLRYTDPTGHIPTLAIGLITGSVSAVVDIGWQLVVDDKSWDTLDWGQVVGAGVGGFIAGATLGLGTAAIGAIGASGALAVGLTLTAGTASSVLGGQMGTLAESGFNEGKRAKGTRTSFSAQAALTEAKQAGLGDKRKMVVDVASGLVGAGMGGLASTATRAVRPSSSAGAGGVLERVMPYPSLSMIQNPGALGAGQAVKYVTGRSSSYLFSEISGALTSKATEKVIRNTRRSQPRRR